MYVYNNVSVQGNNGKGEWLGGVARGLKLGVP